MPNAYISGTGFYVPPRVVTNDDLVNDYGIDTSNDRGVWAEIDRKLELVAREGDPLPSGSTVARIFDFFFTDAGVVLFLEVDSGEDEIWLERAALYPPGRVPTAEEVGEVIAFLASDEASGVSGQAITVALGGLT